MRVTFTGNLVERIVYKGVSICFITTPNFVVLDQTVYDK